MSHATSLLAHVTGLLLRVVLFTLFFGGPVFAVSNLQIGDGSYKKSNGAGLVLMVSLQRAR